MSDLTSWRVIPGSREAIDRGCRCPVIDNGHGRGIPWPRDDGLDPSEHPSFVIQADCPLHGTEARHDD